ncbi:efflux RND transporter permease subunit [Leptospira sp. 201903074]|uniref:efflux RND transporter permease subunit n=1 Tax=Leptospira abararensis TaxID=2810036 RepID=UPI001963C926|nr:efflux RND transporter permease subunit [Leptospira abararensis]MBM9547905.1 efflux RND transporter permease subunit [Leptospira abararensis]
MNQGWVRRFRYRILALVLFLALLSLFSLTNILLGEDLESEKNESVQITNQWPNKTALQVEDVITKPWEKILKLIAGYKQIESISEQGSSQIYLELEKGINSRELIQSIRNEYLLQRHRFPSDSFSPQIRSNEGENQYIFILQKIKRGPEKNRKSLEQKIRNIAGVSNFVHHSQTEEEVLLKIRPEGILHNQFPSVATIFSAIRSHTFGFRFERLNGIWFLKDFPMDPSGWAKLGIPSLFGESLQVSSVGSVSLNKRNLRQGTRINGLSSETMMIKAENAASLYHITNELSLVLSEYTDWILVYASHQDFFDDLFRFLILFFLLDVILFLSPTFFGKKSKDIFNGFISFYSALLVFLGLCCNLSYPIGRPILFSFILWKYFLVFFPTKRFGKWLVYIFFSFCFLWLFVFLNWLPRSFGTIFLTQIYFLLSVPFLKKLFQTFLPQLMPDLRLPFFKTFSLKLKNSLEEKKDSGKSILRFLFPLLLIVGILSSLVSSFKLYSLQPSYGTIQMGRLEFPTSIPEQESIRITKQVEDAILQRKLTDLLVVKQNPSSASFYYRLSELGIKSGLKNLPTESGYFHILGESEINSNRILRFSNANPEILEKTILNLIPWLRTKAGVEEVVLCFQPSTEGLEIHSSTVFRNLAGYHWENSLRERSLELQSAIVGKMLLNNKLTDVRLLLEQDKKLDRYPMKPTKMPSGTAIFSNGFMDYRQVKTPGRIFHKNGETSLEILVKGKEIQWNDLKLKIQEFLNQDVVKLSEISPPKDFYNKYRPFSLFVLVGLFLYRKKEKLNWFLKWVCFLFLWKLHLSFFDNDFFLFGSLAIFLLFLILCIPREFLDWKSQIPLMILLFLSYLLPGEGGRFFTAGFLLIFGFLFIYSKMFQQWKKIKTKYRF